MNKENILHQGAQSHKTLKLITLIILILILCWMCTPMQIRGTPRDDFRAFVINPIPDSVENIEVRDNDIIIHPDRTYCFRFNILPEDLNTIITVNQLELIKPDVTGFQTYAIDAQDWEKEEAHTRFDYYEFREPDDIPQLIFELWVDGVNDKVIYCYNSL